MSTMEATVQAINLPEGVKFEPAKDFGVVLVVNHDCGHPGRYWFAEERYATSDIPRYRAKSCFGCENTRFLAKFGSDADKFIARMKLA